MLHPLEGSSAYYFDLDTDQDINLLFQTKSGKISEISIKDDFRQDFVATDSEAKEISGSYILIHLNGLKKVVWEGIIYHVPITNLEEKRAYSLFSYYGELLSLEMSKTRLNQSYRYELERADDVWKLSIYDEKKNVLFERSYPAGKQAARIFDGISAMISSLTLTKEDGTVIDILHQTTIFKYVPINITSPILVTDKYNLPFDLSSSYRILPDGSYFFTPWEREIFDVSERLELSSPVNLNADLYLYGIHGDIDKEKLYHIRDKDMPYDILSASGRYELIERDQFQTLDQQVLSLDYSVTEKKFSSFVVDYLKDRSYAINLSEDGSEYVVEISSLEDTINTIYDMAEDGQIRTVKVSDQLSPADNSYLVLRKGEEIK